MRSKWVTMLAGGIIAVVLASVAIGLTTPDGSVGDTDAARPAPAASTTPTATPTATRDEPNADHAPASVRGLWPGRPSAVAVKDSKLSWCAAVRTSGAAEAERVFGAAAVDRAACTAVSFIFDKRYSRLSLPRASYAAKDLDFVLPALTGPTVNAYRPRIYAFLAHPDSRDTRNSLGLVLFRGQGTRPGAKHAAAGNGRVFYGKAFSTSGYRHRAVWINPTWTRVTIRVDRSKSEPRIVATFDASAAVPVFNTAARRHDMLTVPTQAKFFLRRSGGTSWRVGGWTISSGPHEYARLELR